MNMLKVSVFLSVFLLVGSATAAEKEWPKVTEDGLHLVPNTKMNAVYAEPGASLAQYNKIQLMDAQVAFKKNWRRDQKQRSANPLAITTKYIEDTKLKLADEFHQVFGTVLQEGGYPVVPNAGDDVLLLRPAIVNLDITNPDTGSAGRSRTTVKSAGEMTLYLELYDSVTGDLLAKAIDRKIDRENSTMYTWSDSATNKIAAQKIIKGWADILLEALNEAKSVPADF